MTYNSGSPGYYNKFLELQEKLRTSEEDRLNLEIKLNEMIQRIEEEKHDYCQRLKSQYNDFVQSDTYRIFRNEQILQALDKIEMKISLLSAKTQRFKLLRRHCQTYLDKANPIDRGRTNCNNALNFLNEKKLPENKKYFCPLGQEKMWKTDTSNYNYVFRHLQRNIQNIATQDKLEETSQSKAPRNLNSGDEKLPAFYSSSQNMGKKPSLETYVNLDDHQHNYKKNEDTQNIYRYRVVGCSPRDIYITNHSLKTSFPNKYGNISSDEITGIKNSNFAVNSVLPRSSEKYADEIRQTQKELHNSNYNISLKKSESCRKPEEYESEDLIIEENFNKHFPLTHNGNSQVEINILANKTIVFRDMRKEKNKRETDVQSQKPAHLCESISKLNFNKNGNVIEDDSESKSKKIQSENQVHENKQDGNINDLNFLEHTPTCLDEKMFDDQNSVRHEEKHMSEINKSLSPIESYAMDALNVDTAFDQKNVSLIYHLTHDDSKANKGGASEMLLPENENAELKSEVKTFFGHSNHTNQNEQDNSCTNGIENSLDETNVEDSQIKQVHNSQDSDFEHDKMKNYDESENSINITRQCEFPDQKEVSNDQYPQYVQCQEPTNQDHNIRSISYQCDDEQSNMQKFNENGKLCNMQYGERDLSYMPYDVNNLAYDQQYYENDVNYLNYENRDQQYEQLQYDQYDQESYETQQRPIYDDHVQEQFDANVPSDAYYSEVEYNQNVFSEEANPKKIEPNSEHENNDTDAVTNLVNILDTDTENISGSVNKLNNESDFDFSNNQ